MGLWVPLNTLGVFWGYKPTAKGPRVPPNTCGVFWGYKFPANGPSGSAENNRGVLGLQIPRQWAIGSADTIGLFWGYKSPANGSLGSAKPNWGVLGLQILRQWALRFRQTQSGCFRVTNPIRNVS
ncbi:Hypothetical protein FKW44_008422 [Caligus rogercresseyi]|uniref:Uncharacterized protein n=1 Tax=Caligus rogercresseyi TaxID=217165 RepID=A0A7T8QU87_CALRO|nr:Hypothetical protein FKW44_008422 [Caligus rogercresseyi]